VQRIRSALERHADPDAGPTTWTRRSERIGLPRPHIRSRTIPVDSADVATQSGQAECEIILGMAEEAKAVAG
jgi:hypothetical protein